MKYNYLDNTPLDDAVEKYYFALKTAGLMCQTETIKSQEAFGRVTANAVYAKRSSPHYNACAMDGIAISSQRSFKAAELSPVRLSKDDYVVVDTGDPLPSKTDCVIMIEDIVKAENEEVLLFSSAVPWQNVRQIGEDICAGDMLIPSYTIITPALAGALLASGNIEIEVLKKPLVGIIPTGDEIVSCDSNLNSGDIPEFNSVIFTGMLSQWGATAKTYPIIPDKLEKIEKTIKTAARECDIVLIIAGSSAGREDYTAKAVENVGTLVIHGLAIKPGKPAVLGHIGAVPCIGIPGYSVSAIIVMEKIVKSVVFDMLCQMPENERIEKAKLSKKLTSSLKYREFLRTRLSYSEGSLIAIPLNRGAGVITSFTNAHGIIDVPQNCEGYEGEQEITVSLLRDIKDIKRLTCITGSHDPLIDEIADIFKRRRKGQEISSSHVGSMGAIMALKSRQAKLGGIHLLDENTGEYNISYIKRYFPEGGISLIEGVGRVQGLMTVPNNPKNIKSIIDVAKKGCSYVNRQKGSGTRILCDFLVKKAGIDSSLVYGYDREEFTHTAVATLIASGSADTGLGIYSAARLYDLAFFPVANEEYDFICRTEYLEDYGVRAFIEVLKSEEFKNRIKAMGGYTLNNPGRIKASF